MPPNGGGGLVREMDHEIPLKFSKKSEGFFREIFGPDIFFSMNV